MIKDIGTLVRPFMAISGWIALIGLAVMGAIQGDPKLFLPEWLVGILLSPGAAYITWRTYAKVTGKA